MRDEPICVETGDASLNVSNEQPAAAADAAVPGISPPAQQLARKLKPRRIANRLKPNYAIKRRGNHNDILKSIGAAASSGQHTRPVPSLPRLAFVERWRPDPDDIDELPPFGELPR
jgi:hypothetical protein